MDYNFQALFTHFNPTDAQIKAMLQDLWRKNDENQKLIDKIRREKDENQKLADKNQKVIDKIHQENEENRAKSVTLMAQKDLQCVKINTMAQKIDDLTNEIQLLKMLAAGNEVSCPVCLESFDTNDHQAYVLSCPHMICAKCLFPALKPNVSLIIGEWTREYTAFLNASNTVTEYSRTSRTATESERRNNGHIIQDQNHPSKRCPVCRVPVTTKLRKICLHS